MLTTKVANITSIVFIFGLYILGFISILGIWEFFDKDVISKSFQTIGFLMFATVVILVAAKFLGKDQVSTPPPVFASVRRITIGVLIVSASLLALTGVLAIWDVLDGSAVQHSMASLGILAFVSFVSVMVCLEREGSQMLQHKFSSGRIVGWAIFILILFWFASTFGRFLFW